MMPFFLTHRQRITTYRTPEVDEINRRVDLASKKAHRDVTRLNRLLEANGITLSINVVSGHK